MAVDNEPMNRLQTSPVLRDLIKYKHKVELPVKADSIFNYAQRFYNKMLNRIKNGLKGTKLTICADEWTSRANRRYMNIQAYANKRKYSLGIFRITERCTGDHLSKLIRNILGKFDIDAKFITTDGAANMGLAAKKAGIVQIKCMLHGLNLGNYSFNGVL